MPKPDAPCLPRRALLLSPLAGWLSALTATEPGSPRVALVVGNAGYASAPLPNAAHDARAMGHTLDSLGFSVVHVQDATKAQIDEAVARTRERLRGRQGIGLFYYAGHGMQLDWRNFLLPVDAVLHSAADVPRVAVDTQSVIDAFKAADTRMNILVLDACRDNPFGGVASAKGLAPMDAPPGTYMAYATAPGNYAEDGSAADGNGLYTRFLLKEIQRPDARIEDVFKRVRAQVRQASQGRQVPWDSSSLEDDFVFATGQQLAALTRRQREAAFEAEKAAWDRVKDSDQPADLYDFLQRHPVGGMAELATARLERLERARVTPQPDRLGEVQDASLPRNRHGDRYEFRILDGLTGLQKGNLSVEAHVTEGDRVEFRGLRRAGPAAAVTAAGAVLADGLGSYDPPYSMLPGGEYQLGKRWSGRSARVANSGARGWMDYSGRIAARERIETAAGPLDTWRVEMSVMFETGEHQQRTLWMQPDWGLALVLRIVARKAGDPIDIFVRELVSRQRTA